MDRKAAIISKNEAFAALEGADPAIAKRARLWRLGLAGPVPETWEARRLELSTAYDMAKITARETLTKWRK